MPKLAFGIGLCALLGWSACEAATCPAHPVVLTNGATADATQVMADLDNVLNCANSSLAPIDNPSFTGNVTLSGGGVGVVVRATVANHYNYLDLDIVSGLTGNTDAGVGLGSGIYTTYGGQPSFPFSEYGALVIYGRDDAAQGYIDFRTGFGSGRSDRLIITPTGNIGVGTASPLALLDIAGSNSPSDLRLSRSGNPAVYLSLSAPGGANTQSTVTVDNVGVLGLSGNGGVAIGSYSNSDIAMPVGGLIVSGNVGIGTSNPTQALEINGEIKVDTFASGSSTAVCENGNVLSSCSSSIRYKENVENAPYGLNEVMRMRPVTFKWKGRDEKDFGLIAEEVEKIDSVFVTYKNGKVEGVKYAQLIAVLINAIQKQQQEIEDLSAANKTQSKTIKQLNAMIESVDKKSQAKVALK